MSNGSSLQISSPVHGGKKIKKTHHPITNNTDEYSIYESVLNVPQVSVGPSRVSQALQSSFTQQPQNRSQPPSPQMPPPPPLQMPWPRSALPRGSPPVRLGHSRSQLVQGNPSTRPRIDGLMERPKSVGGPRCTQCLTPFSIVNPEYQCHNCEKFFDHQCSSKMITITGLSLLPVRVDDECFAKLSAGGSRVRIQRAVSPSDSSSSWRQIVTKQLTKDSVDETFDPRPYLEKKRRALEAIRYERSLEEASRTAITKRPY